MPTFINFLLFLFPHVYFFGISFFLKLVEISLDTFFILLLFSELLCIG